MIFTGRNQIAFAYGRYGYTRNNGTVFHGGADITALDNKTVRMPWFKQDGGTDKVITGKVVSARIVISRLNRTWEWGWYVCVKLDAQQTPDKVNYLYFCHNKTLLVKVGDRVKSGDSLAIMGNSGNAALASPPIEHVHLEVRAAQTGAGLDPTRYMGIPNAVGIYGDAPKANAVQITTSSLNVRSAPGTNYAVVASLAIDDVAVIAETSNGWGYISGKGWISLEYTKAV